MSKSRKHKEPCSLPGFPGRPGAPGLPLGPTWPRPGGPGGPRLPGAPGRPGSPESPFGPGKPGEPGSPPGPGSPFEPKGEGSYEAEDQSIAAAPGCRLAQAGPSLLGPQGHRGVLALLVDRGPRPALEHRRLHRDPWHPDYQGHLKTEHSIHFCATPLKPDKDITLVEYCTSHGPGAETVPLSPGKPGSPLTPGPPGSPGRPGLPGSPLDPGDPENPG
ncbi:hypothetical protein GJAV_G00125180 [Gymnothorax javanicus]|nr:hypothetical protein GJAV_G00125180 [Gymnothorax javanicus]